MRLDGGKATKKFVASCSDDRTIRIWDISSCGSALANSNNPPTIEGYTTGRGTGFHINTADDEAMGQESCIAKEWGHEARIWGLRFLDFEIYDEFITFNLISRSEDCTCQVWNFKTRYELIEGEYILQKNQTTLKSISSYAYHVGKSIWSMEVVNGKDSFGVYTGGADSNIVSFTIPRMTGEYNSGRRTEVYTPDEICEQSTLLNLDQSLDSANTNKKPKNDGKINQFGFVSDDCFIASFTSGSVLLGHIPTGTLGKGLSGDEPLLQWSTISMVEGIGSYGAISGIPDRGIGLIGTGTGRILWYNNETRSITNLADIGRSVSDIFVVHSPKYYSDLTTEPITFITSSRALSYANLFIVEPKPSPRVIAKQQLALPAEFVVSSALFIPSASLLVLGARWGRIAVFNFTSEIQETTAESPLCVFTAHKKDTVTSISYLGAAADAATRSVDIITTGRDGAYCIHRIQENNSQFTVKTLHRSTPPIGPYIEGSRLDAETKDLILWGFRNTYFVLWNETTQTEILSIECGGAHRRWVYHGSSMHHVLLWIKASTFNIMSETFQCHGRVRQGGHGREIKTTSISKLGIDGAEEKLTILATGAEDTEIRFFAIDGQERGTDSGFRCVRAIKKHSAGLQHLQWSTCGNFLFSSAGREEFYVWRIRWIPGFGVCVLNEGEAPTGRVNSDLRTTHFDLVSVATDDTGCESFLIAMAYSNSTTKVFYYVSSPEGGVFTLLAQGSYTSNCITQIRLVMSDHELRLVTGSTDGHIAVWDLAAPIKPYFNFRGRSMKRKDGVPLPAEPSSIKWEDRRPTHQSSIKAMEILPLSDAQVLLITGGDDNCLAFSTLKFSMLESSASLVDDFSTTPYPNAHASAINAITLVRRADGGSGGRDSDRVVEFLVASSGNDQRIKLWSASASVDGGPHVSLQSDMYTAVADLSAIDQFAVQVNGVTREHLVVCGVGMEMWKVNDDAKQTCTMEKVEAREYLENLVDKVLRVHTSDSRAFVGLFKCTDNVGNPRFLSSTHEYRCPTEPAIQSVSSEEASSPKPASSEPFDITADMSSRFIGLVVIPGQHITKIELDKSTATARDDLRQRREGKSHGCVQLSESDGGAVRLEALDVVGKGKNMGGPDQQEPRSAQLSGWIIRRILYSYYAQPKLHLCAFCAERSGGVFAQVTPAGCHDIDPHLSGEYVSFEVGA
ncbi:uncharacterized protein GIQ15_05978 [Arthroderma uncinatum]|uniref:uncharacterized protein n=1 Tax=Arthroderma uncinatum TaxID=74035 RepID=UPI00144A6383|nr:uncharacterized protein GIQ15_05978 [Arthroderma uncinatum]KAF3480631.1 hypothetical protein GIQ15_05978 [Arthroderma uncinatum]